MRTVTVDAADARVIGVRHNQSPIGIGAQAPRRAEARSAPRAIPEPRNALFARPNLHNSCICMHHQ